MQKRGGGKLKLTLKQQRFADEYIICGNATQAAIKAGYSEKTAYSQGQRLLKNVEIKSVLKKRTEELFDERAMSVAEALAISASIARGEVQQGYSKTVDKLNGDEVLKEIGYEYTPTVEERQRSLDHILKVNGAYIDRKEIEHTGAVQFIDDIGGMTNETEAD